VTSVGSLINGAAEKTTPIDADLVGLSDSADSGILKKLSWSNVKARLKAYNDTLYAKTTDIVVEEFSSNSNTTNTATDTTSFAYGSSGSGFPNGAVGTSYVRRVRFQNSITELDCLILEFYDSTNSSWVPASTRLTWHYAGSTTYGMRMSSANSTDVDVTFGSGGLHALGASTYGANSSEAWSLITSWKWRVRKIRAKT
jgi:hypothetical protein